MNRPRVSPLPYFALLALLAFSQSSCAKKPTMRLNHAQVSGVQIGFPPNLGVLMNVVVDVYNPNGYDVAIRAMRGQVVMAERYTLPIDFRPQGEGVWLAADRTTSISVPVSIPVDLAMRLVREAWAAPTIPFHVQGRADVTATRSLKIEKDDYEVDERGVIPREQVEASIRGVFLPGVR